MQPYVNECVVITTMRPASRVPGAKARHREGMSHEPRSPGADIPAGCGEGGPGRSAHGHDLSLEKHTQGSLHEGGIMLQCKGRPRATRCNRTLAVKYPKKGLAHGDGGAKYRQQARVEDCLPPTQSTAAGYTLKDT